VQDPPAGEPGGAPVAAQPPRTIGPLAVYSGVVRRPRYLLTVLGYAAYTFGLGGLGFWMPVFLERVRGVPADAATTGLGAIVVVTGLIGTMSGGWLGDYCVRRSRQGYLWFSAVATLAAVPFALLALRAAEPRVFYAAIVVAELLLFMSTGPVNAAIANAVSPLERASAIALSMFVIHLLGDIPSPPLIGHLSDVGSLEHAVLVVPLAIALGGLIWLAAARAGVRTPHSA
jgi:MFS transporter, Spinster family, sphingosine-1-phosphate transporter